MFHAKKIPASPMTGRSQESFAFESHFSREAVARFDGGALTSDAGALLLREVDRRIHLMARLAECFDGRRHPLLVKHPAREMVAQRVYSLAPGHEDLNDHDQLREDPLLAVLSGKKQAGEAPLAGKSTLDRLELCTGQPSRYKKARCRQEAAGRLLADLCLEAHDEPPEWIALDLDVTDLPLHGQQEGRFFHGCYDEHCHLPLHIFAGGHLLCARLRAADQDAAAGSTQEVARIVGRIRSRWPEAPILVRGGSGFCRDEWMDWCENHGVGCVLGLARNERLRKRIAPQMEEAARLQQESGQPARVFTEFEHQTATGSWSRPRRVAATAEQIAGKENPRFAVSSLGAGQWPAQELHELLCCARGEMENRIKEQLSLFAPRVSAGTMKANQMRMNLSACAHVLLHALRRIGLRGTEMERAQAATIRLRLLKIGARIRITVRKIWLSMASGFPLQAVFRQAWAQLRC